MDTYLLESISKPIFDWISQLQFIFKPHYWQMNYRYSEQVDTLINQLLDEYDYEIDPILGNNDSVVILGGHKIWVGNRPYASMRFYQSRLENFRPSRLTIKRGLDKYYEWRKI